MTEAKWQGLDEDQKVDIAVELFTEILKSVDEHKATFDDLPWSWTEKDVKTMKKALRILKFLYGISD